MGVLRGTLTFHETRNGERRTVPLTGQALALMQQHAKVRRLDAAPVFPRCTEIQPMGMRAAWEYAVKRAGISAFRFHIAHASNAHFGSLRGKQPQS